MASASDIITYIGIPLAVLGVSPILYTFVLSVFTRRRIHATLIQHGHKPLNSTHQHDGFTIRSSPMTMLLEIELPRYTIAPLERDTDDYWRTAGEGQEQNDESHRLLNRAESTTSMAEEGRVRGYLRGGSWRAFNWKRLTVGKKLYRIQYEDELREPAAEIDFEDLVHFLLDWGAVPDTMGWEKLRSSGLWTPAGTVLLEKDDTGNDDPKIHRDWVLRTSVPDESDGVLSLSIRWSNAVHGVSDTRGAASLPPGWGRLRQPALLSSGELQQAPETRRDLPTRIESLKLGHKLPLNSISFRFNVSDKLIHKIHWEASSICTGSISQPFIPCAQSTASTWFTCTAASLIVKQSLDSRLWGFEIPKPISAFARKDSIPCGILVLLGILDDSAAPQWSSSGSNDQNSGDFAPNTAQRHHQRLLAQREAEKLEATMPPDQARVHRMNREAESRRQQHSDMMAQLAERRQRDERRVSDAIASPRMHAKLVAEACLAWLIQRGEVGREWTVEQLAEAVLYLMVVDGQQDDNDVSVAQNGQEKKESHAVVQVLDEWMDWSAAGGMNRQQYALLEEFKVEFCFAASIVAVIQMAEATGHVKASVDIMECLRVWRKIRLG